MPSSPCYLCLIAPPETVRTVSTFYPQHQRNKEPQQFSGSPALDNKNSLKIM